MHSGRLGRPRCVSPSDDCVSFVHRARGSAEGDAGPEEWEQVCVKTPCGFGRPELVGAAGERGWKVKTVQSGKTRRAPGGGCRQRGAREVEDKSVQWWLW